MAKDYSIAKINQYRENNSRCRTCIFAEGDYSYWFCTAKRKRFEGNLRESRFRGIFCSLYEARKYGE